MNLNPDVEAGEGWANGTFRMDAKDIDAFYHANLYINVATTTNVRALRGRIVQNLLGLAQEFSRSPILLHGNPPNRTAIRYHSYNTLALTTYIVHIGERGSQNKIVCLLLLHLRLLVMSSSRAGSSHPFFIQLEIENWPKTSRNFNLFLMTNYFNRIGLKMIKFCT